MRTARPRPGGAPAILALGAGLLAAGCAGEGILDPTAGPAACFNDPNFAFDPTLSCVQDVIFTPTCATAFCHLGSSAPMGLNLAPGASYSNLVGVVSTEDPPRLLVSAGDPDGSYLIHKLEGTAVQGVQMPFGGPPLDPAEIAAIREWILRGALDD